MGHPRRAPGDADRDARVLPLEALDLSAHLVDRTGSAGFELDEESIQRKLQDEGFFWLDLHRPSDQELEAVGEAFGFHPLAVEDSEHFGQRAKCESYDSYVFLVLYGYSPDEDGLVEVHCYFSERYLVTVRRDEAPAFEELRRRLTDMMDGSLALYEVADALVDSFFPALTRFDERLDLIEEAMFDRPSDRQLQDILAMKRRLAMLRKAIAPQRDLFGQLAAGAVKLPGLSTESARRFRNVYDHLIRLTEQIDTQRDLMTAAIDVYVSTASNRLNVTTKQLAVIATIFLPLTFITGFFGQNFGWMVDHVDSWPAFVGLGIGVELVAIAILFGYFRRKGWF